MNKKLIIGNWKMNKNEKEIKSFFDSFSKSKDLNSIKCEYGVAPTFLDLMYTKELFSKNKKMIIASQDAHFEKSGAFTGAVSYQQLKDHGINYSIIGHSERREYFNDTDEVINKKVITLIENDMVPILCVGENLKERSKKKHFKVVAKQLHYDLNNVNIEKAKNIVIAYEPIWAIGTGKSATSEDAIEMAKFIRQELKTLFNEEVAKEIKILYGGSVNDKNVKEYLSNEFVDGALVGGASLDASKFIELLKGAN